MIERAQVVEIVLDAAGEIEAVMLPFAGRTADGVGYCAGPHFCAAGMLVPGGVVPPAATKWDRLVVCTKEFATRHGRARTAQAPTPNHRIFFARE